MIDDIKELLYFILFHVAYFAIPLFIINLVALFITITIPQSCDAPRIRWTYITPLYTLGCYLNEEIPNDN
jgi:hypothetical protein